MKSKQSLYSRLALITSVTLVVGYFVVYAAWTNLDLAQVQSGETITSTLMQNIVNKINDIGARTDGIYSSAGKIGIGTANPSAKLNLVDSVSNWITIQSTGIDTNTALMLQNDAISWSLQTRAANNDNFEVIQNGTDTRLSINTTGKVGIGTISPSDTLTVNGGVTANTFTSPVAWSTISVVSGWNSYASCRRIGSFVQIRGYVAITGSDSTFGWGTQVGTLPVECRPSNAIQYPPGACWNSTANGVFACFTQINPTGEIYLYTTSTASFHHFSFAGTYPAN